MTGMPPSDIGGAHEPRSLRDCLDVLGSGFADVPTAVKVLKIGEEFGEAIQAYIGVGGFNPRKGVYATNAEVKKELADIVVTALIALGDFSEDAIQTVTNRLREVTERHEREVCE